MKTLVVQIDECWPAAVAAEWALLGARGALLQQGRSEPRHWPDAERRVLVLSGAQVSLGLLRLPRHRRADRERLIAYALEERLPADIDRQHFTLLETRGEEALIAIVDGDRLRRVLDAFEALKLPLHGAHGRLQTLPARTATAAVVDDGTTRYWRWSNGEGMAEDAGGSLEVSSLASRALAATGVSRLRGPAAPALATGAGVPGEPEEMPWYAVAGQNSLLHGRFARRVGAGGARWRWPLRIATGAVAAHLVFGVVSVLFGRQQERELNTRTQAVFEASFPGAAVVDPVLQMRRQLNELRPRHGALRDDDLLALLNPLADALGPEARGLPTRLRYEGGALEVALPPGFDGARRQALIEALALRGLRARATGGDGILSLTRSPS